MATHPATTTQPALTKSFTAPSSCFSGLVNDPVDQPGPSPSATECFPPGWIPTPGFYFSPGDCLNGFTTASTSSKILGTLTETAAFCCHPSYIWTTDKVNPHVVGCLSYYAEPASTRTVKVFSGTSVAGAITATGGGWASASSLEVRFQASDASVLSPSPAPSVPVTATTTVTAAASATVTATASSIPPPGGLSTRAKVGISVGVPLGVLLLISIGFSVHLCLRLRRAEASNTHVDASSNPEGLAVEEATAVEIGGGKEVPVEMTGARGSVVELDSYLGARAL